MNNKNGILLILGILFTIGIIISVSFLSVPSNKSLSGNVIKLNEIDNVKIQGKNISNKITGEVISKRTFNSPSSLIENIPFCCAA